MKSKHALLLGGSAHLSDVLALLQARELGAKAMTESLKVVLDRLEL